MGRLGLAFSRPALGRFAGQSDLDNTCAERSNDEVRHSARASSLMSSKRLQSGGASVDDDQNEARRFIQASQMLRHKLGLCIEEIDTFLGRQGQGDTQQEVGVHVSEDGAEKDKP